MDEEALVNHAKQGDLDAFNHLVLNYQRYVYNLAFRILGNMEEAEDATQQAFLSAYKGLHAFRGGSFRAWISRIVSNACYDEIRQKKRKPTIRLEPAGENDEEIETPHWLADSENTPENTHERNQLVEVIERCIHKLPVEFRVVAILVDVQGMDYQEAARVIDKPLGTVKSRLARARYQLRECLQSDGELLPLSYRLDVKS